MKIVLINPPCFGVDDDHVEQNLGISYLAAALRHGGFPDTDILELTGTGSLEKSLSLLPDAEVYGFSCYTTSYGNVLAMIRHIRETLHPGAYIILGGPHPTAKPEETLRESGADLVITGEGEAAIVEAVGALRENAPLRGILPGRPIRNLDKIPYPLRLTGKDNTFSRTFHGEKTFSLIATRGCPYSCLHCNSNIMGAGSRGIRSRSVENIIGEIRELKALGAHGFRFNDDNFLAHAQIHELLEALGKEDIRYRVFGHVRYLTDSICRELKESGCGFVSVGIESMNPDNLRFLRKTDNLRYIANLENADRYGLVIRASFMVGLPFDTDESIERYFGEAADLPMQEFAVYPLLPYPGTEIERRAEELHYRIVDHDYDDYMQMGKGRQAGYCLAYDNPETGIRFGPEDVRRWKIRAEELLARTMTHMSASTIAR